MKASGRILPESDILFLLETVLPERTDREQLVAVVREDPDFLEALLRHEQVFQRLLGDEETLLHVSPYLFFSVLLRQARRDMGGAAYTLERRQHQRVAIFDAPQAAQLLDRQPVRDYLAEMLASFTRTQSMTRRVRVRKGVWRRLRFNDLDVDSLIHYAGAIDEGERFEVYKRIADVCLFLAGMFPEYVESQYRYPWSGALRPGRRRAMEDYEREGRAFYGLAASSREAQAAHLAPALAVLARDFQLAEKPLAFLAQHYLRMRKNQLFEL